MPLRLYFHPLSSFCHKALIALYESGTPFEPLVVDFSDEASTAAFKSAWPIAKMPALRDDDRDQTVGESTVVIEYLDIHYPGERRLIPAAPERALEVRLWDRVFDNYIHLPMQAIVADRLRPEGKRDPFGVASATDKITAAYGIVESQLDAKTWITGDAFTLADCAAAPALFYASIIVPFGAEHANLKAYLDRLMTRPSYARALKEAEPYFDMFPMEKKPRIAPARTSPQPT
jgi:glutathione S-transferase